jgi:hypothetical protein
MRGARFAHTTFDNANPFVRWDDQLFLVDEAVNVNQANPGRMQMSQAVDFDADQFWLFGGINLPARTRVDASVSIGRTSQDEAFLPMTINTLLTAAPLPASSYDGEHRNTTARLFVSGRPTKSVRWSAWYRLYDLDNNSPELTFSDYVAADYQFPLCGTSTFATTMAMAFADDRIARKSLPYSFKRESFGGMGGWAPTHWFNGSLSAERLRYRRGFPL